MNSGAKRRKDLVCEQRKKWVREEKQCVRQREEAHFKGRAEVKLHRITHVIKQRKAFKC